MLKLVYLYSSTLLWLLVSVVTEHYIKAEYMRGCYFTNWARYRQGRGKFTLSTYPTGMCTHIFYAFAKFGYSFEAEPTDPEDLPSSYYEGTYATVTNLKKQDPNLKVLLSFGGYSFGGYLFSLMASTENNRETFIRSAIEFVRKYDFDGIDIDWEYPSTNDKHTYVLLMEELQSAALAESQSTGRPRLLITAALPAGKATIDVGYDVAAFSPYLDYLLLMTYDYHGSWEMVTGNNAPLFARPNETDKTLAVSWTMNYYDYLGAPKNKIIMGFPNYGRGWKLKNSSVNYVGAPAIGPSPAFPYTQTAGIAAYFEICEQLTKPGLQDRFNYVQEVPFYVYESEWMSYDDVESFQIKAEWARDNGFGGGFVWTLDFDDFNNQCPESKGVYPLTRTMSNVFLNGSPPIVVTSTTRTTVSSSTSRPVITTERTTTSAGSSSEFICPASGLYPDPLNCARFYQCAFGKSDLLTCPNGLYFNPVYMVCDYPTNVNCKMLS